MPRGFDLRNPLKKCVAAGARRRFGAAKQSNTALARVPPPHTKHSAQRSYRPPKAVLAPHQINATTHSQPQPNSKRRAGTCCADLSTHTRTHKAHTTMAAEQAAALVGVLNKVIRYAVGVGVGVSALQTSMYTGVVDFVCLAAGAALCAAQSPRQAPAFDAPDPHPLLRLMRAQHATHATQSTAASAR